MSFWTGMGGALLSGGIGLANLFSQVGEQRYQRDFAENAVSIRAKDLQKAGLSKTLAAGSAANAPPSLAPQMADPDPLGKALLAANSRKAKSEAELAGAKTEGQNIINKYTGAIMQEDIEAKRLANLIQRETAGFQINNAKSLAASARIQVKTDTYNMLAAKLAPKLAAANLTNLQKEGLLKTATAALQNALAREKDWNLDYAKDKGLPTTAGSDLWNRLIDRVTTWALEQAKQNNGKIIEIIPRERQENVRRFNRKQRVKEQEGGNRGATRAF